MKLKKSHLNGKNGSSKALPQKDKIVFPVTYELKVILELSRPKNELRDELESLFDRHRISFTFLSEKPSSKGNYTSLSFKVTLIDELQMKALYAGLEGIKEIKFAV